MSDSGGTMATPYSTGRQVQSLLPNPTYSTRMSAPKAATLVAAAMKAVTAVGAPW